ncbi:carbohydrate kinase family protein [Microlunatus antarcticus]|uniref:Fructokinase n=1 Tax=Microlunatus antarcticus TaxID=53388 RepID=A0A7W5P638_9ACTN|nr:PfkB family carbohydrate kinase [Microlunatus antarcticus]MBB3326048.1 fructokinase [Microlunatus antarcticus]
MTRFVVCGETLIDLVESSTDVPTSFRSTWEALSAGGPMNSAVALGTLGAEVQFLGRLSGDSFGRQLREHVVKADVGLDLATESTQATSIAVVSLDDDGVASYVFHFHDTANFGWRPEELPALDAGDWLHIASLSCVVSPGNQVLLDWMPSVRSGVSYDINVRPTVITDPGEYWARVEPWLRAVGERDGILKASDVDIAFLAQAAGGSDPVEIVTGWVERYGLGLAVVTLGPDGSVAVEPGGAVTRVPGFPTEVVDTVGAGDTFMAGFLEARVEQELSLEESLRRGAAAASIVCSRQGAQPPTAAEVDALIARATHA